MPMRLRGPQRIVSPGIRFPIHITGNHTQPLLAIEVVFNRNDNTAFELSPVQDRYSTGNFGTVDRDSVEWHLHCQSPYRCQVRATPKGQNFFYDVFNVAGSIPFSIDIGGQDDKFSSGPDLFALLRGSIAVPLPSKVHSSFEPVFDSMWPTGNRSHIKYLLFEPTGLYAAGFLPQGVYGNGEQQLVVLRVPQNQSHNAAEAEWEWTNFCFPPLIVDGHTEPLTPLTASGHIKQHADALRAFSPRNSFIDDVKFQQSQNVRIQVARELIGSCVESIVWTANELSTTIVLGTATSPEAQFSPVTVKGEIKRRGGVPDAWDGENTVWKSGSIAGERVESFDELADDRSFTLTLTRTPDTSGPREPKIAIHLNDMLVATSVPLRDMNGTSGERIQRGTAWLCTKDGWLAIDRTQVMAPTAVPLAPRSPMSGLIDVDRMRHDFDPNGIQLGVKLRVGALADDSQVSLRHTVTSLSLTISNPTTFLSMQSLWANATDDNQRPPEITPIPPKTDESKKHLPLGPPTDSMLNERFSGAEFVTVSKPDSDADGDGLIIKVALSDAFRITLPSGSPKTSRYTLWRPIPKYPLAQNMPTSLPDERNRFMATNRGFIPFRITDGLDVKIDLDGPLPCVIEVEDGYRIEVAFDAQQLPSDLFLTTLPGFGIDLSSKAPEKWHYRHAPPVLDEEFACVAESPDESIPMLSDARMDLTRVVGATGFAFENRQDGKGTAQATGWLHRTKDNPDGAVTVEWSSERLQGRSPSIDLSIAAGTGTDTIRRQFYRRAPEFVRLQAGGNETDEVQVVSIPSGWIEIRITFGPQTTGTIPCGWTDSQIEEELWRIVGQHNANVVSSTDPSGKTITVTFVGDLARAPQQLLSLKRHASELTAALNVTATAPADCLPKFSVQFAPEGEDSLAKKTHRIVHNGQPLVTYDNWDKVPEKRRIVTLDGDGKVCEEPENGRSRHYRCKGDDQISATETVVMFPLMQNETENITAMTVELCGVAIGDSFAKASLDSHQQRWQFHDGAHGWPRLLGFYLRPLKLLRVELDGAGRVVLLHLTATLLQGIPSDATPPADAYGEISLVFSKESSAWKIKTSVDESTIDWHFTVAENTVSLLRLTGKFPTDSEIVIGPYAKLSWQPDRVVIKHESGLIDLVDRSDLGIAMFHGDMSNGKVTFATTTVIEPSEPNNLRASLASTTIPQKEQGDRLRVLKLENYKFTWITSQHEAELTDKNRTWSLSIPSANIETDLECYTLGPGRLLLGTTSTIFRSHRVASDGPLLLKASDQPDVGFILAAFSPKGGSQCQSLSGRILTHLVDSEPGWDSRVSAELVIEDKGDIHCRISGWIHAPNAIQFQDEQSAKIEHNTRVIFDQVPVPLECIFDGILKGDEDVEVAAVVEHRFIFPGTPDRVGRRFQVPQLVRLTSVKRQLLRVLNKKVDDNSCLIDLSTTACWQVSEKHPQATGRPDIDDGFLALNFSTRKLDLCNTGMSRELRLPAMVGFHRDRNGNRFTIEGHTGVIVPDSPTTNYSFASLGAQAQTYADFVTQTVINFDRRRYFAFGNEPENGTSAVESSGLEFHMHGNLWKAIRFPCTLTSSTVLEFDFKSGQEGQRHGIGFSKTLTPPQKQWAQVWGNQQDGTYYRIEPQYDGSGTWNHFRIPIGRLMPGSFEYLVFICDHDVPRPDGESRFRNVKLYDVPIALIGEFSKRGQTAITLRHDELLKSLKRPHASHVFDYLSSVPVFLEGNNYHFIPNKLPDLAMIRDASIDAHIEAQTVVRTHHYEQFPQPLAESTVVHFPHEIFTEASQDPGVKENVFDCQLLTFVGNRTRLIAHERVAHDAGLGKEDETIIGWAERILESRRIGEGGLVIKDYKSLIHVTRPSGGAKSLSSSLGAYQTFGLTQQFTSATQDPRCRYPDSDLTNGLQADPTMDLLLFESKVDLPSEGQPIVAATRSRVVGTWFGNVWRYHFKDFSQEQGQVLAGKIVQNSEHRVWQFLGSENIELFERISRGPLDTDNSDDRRMIASELNRILQLTALSNSPEVDRLEFNQRCFYNRQWLETQFPDGPCNAQIPKVQHTAAVRPARSALLATTKDATIQGDTISLTRWQNTEFEICGRKESPYPSVDPKPILHRGASPVSGLLLPGEALRTVLPPVTEISCWQARPGELSRETWDLNRISFENQSQRIGISIVAAATLRKPRAVAGNSEAVELQLEEHKALFSDTRWRDQKYRFHYARLRLSQILGASKTPSEITGVMTTEKQFYPAVENPRLAENRSVMANYVPPSSETDSEQIPPSPETLRLFLLAKESFLPTETTKILVKHSVTGQEIEIDIPETITVLAYAFNNSIGSLSDSEVFPELDDNSSADFFFDTSKSVVYSNPIGSLLRLAGPSDKDSFWKLLDNKVYALDYSISSQKMILEELYKTPPRPIFIGVRKFKLAHENPNKPGTWRWTAVGTSSVIFEHVIQFLDMKSSIVVPRTAVSLLAWPREIGSSGNLDLNGESCALAGFGRLADRDFSPIEPRYRPLVDPDHIQWLRTGQLQTVLRNDSLDMNNGKCPFEFDVVVNGPGGELIPTAIP
jgi:hypothetical protein